MGLRPRVGGWRKREGEPQGGGARQLPGGRASSAGGPSRAGAALGRTRVWVPGLRHHHHRRRSGRQVPEPPLGPKGTGRRPELPPASFTALGSEQRPSSVCTVYEVARPGPSPQRPAWLPAPVLMGKGTQGLRAPQAPESSAGLRLQRAQGQPSPPLPSQGRGRKPGKPWPGEAFLFGAKKALSVPINDLSSSPLTGSLQLGWH